MAFDTLTFANRLKAAGVAEKQAEVQAEALRDAVEGEVATKQDIQLLRQEMKAMQYQTVIVIVTALGALEAIFKFIV